MNLGNLLVWSLQTCLVVATGAVIAKLLPPAPRLRLMHWQLLLAACLVLPLVQRWQPADISGSLVTVGSAVIVARPDGRSNWSIPWTSVLVAVLASGSALFLTRLGLGAIRIRLYRLRSSPLPLPGMEAEFRISAEVSGPVTFGWRKPVVLLPEYYLELPADLQHAIREHELTHVRRKDWLCAIGEEIVRAALWFHPAIWFVLSRIQLAREQVVDQEVVSSTGNRERYLEALLAIAGLKSRIDFVPAPLFLRKRHLSERVATILNEVTQMNQKRMLLSLALSSAAIAFTGAIAATVLPLRAAAQTTIANIQAQAKSGPRIVYQVAAQYPPDAKLRRIEGRVVVEVQVNTRGLVSDARVVSGPDELRRAALQAVLQWEFEADDRPARAEVELDFHLAGTGVAPEQERLGVLRRIEFLDVPNYLRARIVTRIPVKEGESLTEDAPQEIGRAIAEVDSRLRANFTADGVLQVSMAPLLIRVGGNAQAMKIVKKVPPLYPPLAKQARLQGTVRFMVEITKEGKVQNVVLVSGHPLLVPSSQEAIRQWEYTPTLLNGEPVAVVTQVDINFTLSE
ncbi:MAG TPA: M56 family metallopeptidase [Bryobacteraceae bacterium]|nr:M56 family metallopeptidase [Bryobacteraceae bacterium]